MQDRLKFRLFVTENDSYPDKVGYINPELFCIHPDGEESFFNADYDFTECVVEQCTGLKDKNGKLIYEGDIVDYDGDRGKIFYCEAAMMWGIMQRDWSTYGQNIKRLDTYIINCEVIGNIHENADLLGEDE